MQDGLNRIGNSRSLYFFAGQNGMVALNSLAWNLACSLCFAGLELGSTAAISGLNLGPKLGLNLLLG